MRKIKQKLVNTLFNQSYLVFYQKMNRFNGLTEQNKGVFFALIK